jgi:hypothetical protein
MCYRFSSLGVDMQQLYEQFVTRVDGFNFSENFYFLGWVLYTTHNYGAI